MVSGFTGDDCAPARPGTSRTEPKMSMEEQILREIVLFTKRPHRARSDKQCLGGMQSRKCIPARYSLSGKSLLHGSSLVVSWGKILNAGPEEVNACLNKARPVYKTFRPKSHLDSILAAGDHSRCSTQVALRIAQIGHSFHNQ